MEGHLELPVTFFGHTHLQGTFRLAPRESRANVRRRLCRSRRDSTTWSTPAAWANPATVIRGLRMFFIPLKIRPSNTGVSLTTSTPQQPRSGAAGLPEVLARRLYDGK